MNGKTYIYIIFIATLVCGSFAPFFEVNAQTNVTSFLEASTFFPEFSGSGDNGRATLKGYVDLRDNVRTANTWFEWGETPSLGKRTSSRTVSRSQEFKSSISSLDANKYYYVRAGVQDAFGSAFGDTIRFRIADGSVAVVSSAGVIAPPLGGGSIYPAPKVTTKPAQVVSGNTVIVNGFTATDANISTSAYFEWGTSPLLENQSPAKNIGAQPNMDFSDVLFGLTPNTVYYYRAVVVNPGGKTFGGVLTFYTNPFLSPPPEYIPPVTGGSVGGGGIIVPLPEEVGTTGLPYVITYIPVISDSVVQFKGFAEINENKKVKKSGNTWFEWGETPSLGKRTSSQVFGPQGIFVSEKLTGFTPDKTYYYRAAVQDPFGTQYGEVISFSLPKGSASGATTQSSGGIFGFLTGGGKSTTDISGEGEKPTTTSEGTQTDPNQIVIVPASQNGNGGFLPTTLFGWLLVSTGIFVFVALVLYIAELSKRLKELKAREMNGNGNGNGNGIHRP